MYLFLPSLDDFISFVIGALPWDVSVTSKDGRQTMIIMIKIIMIIIIIKIILITIIKIMVIITLIIIIMMMLLIILINNIPHECYIYSQHNSNEC